MDAYKESLTNSISAEDNSQKTALDMLRTYASEHNSIIDEMIAKNLEWKQSVAEQAIDSATNLTTGAISTMFNSLPFAKSKSITGSYSSGGVNSKTGLAMLHGTRSASETIFNAADSKKLYDLVHNSSDLSSKVAENIIAGLNAETKKTLQNNSTANGTIYNEWKFMGDIVTNNPEDFMRKCLNIGKPRRWKVRFLENKITQL